MGSSRGDVAPCTVERSRIVALHAGGEEAGEVRWLCVVGWLLSRRWIGAGVEVEDEDSARSVRLCRVVRPFNSTK